MPILGSSGGEKAGSLKAWPASSEPAGWLKCNGAAVSRSLYAALFNVIGTTYGAGDGSTTFNLPDYRGEFIRGLDDGRGVDASRTLGVAQAADFASHTHTGSSDTHAGHSHVQGGGVTGGSGTFGVTSQSSGYQATFSTGTGTTMQNTNTAGSHSHVLTINNAGGTETRPRNQAALWIIKY